jgi:hypothetical protein
MPIYGTSWTEGMLCMASTPLPNGSYRYRFVGRDDGGASATGEPTAWKLGPSLDAAPQLWCTALTGRTRDFVHPNQGTAGTTRFRFSVQYTDGESNRALVRRIVIQRQEAGGTWRNFHLGPMAPLSGTPRGGQYYDFSRKLPAGQYRFRMLFRDEDGTATGSDSQGGDCTQWRYGPVVTEAAAADAVSSAGAAVSALCAVPTAAGAQVTFALASAAEVDAHVLNIAGRPVSRLCRARPCEPGTNTLLWNAQSDSGLPVPNGTYLVEVMARTQDGAQGRALTRVLIRR